MARSYWSPADEPGFPARGHGERGWRRDEPGRYDEEYSGSAPDDMDERHLRRRSVLRRDWRDWGDPVSARRPRPPERAWEGAPGEVSRGYDERSGPGTWPGESVRGYDERGVGGWPGENAPGPDERDLAETWPSEPRRRPRRGGDHPPERSPRRGSGGHHAAGPRQPPPGYRRYLSREEYGIPHEEAFERPPAGAEPPRRGRGHNAGPRRPPRPERHMEPGDRSALFGRAGLRRYSADYDEQWW